MHSSALTGTGYMDTVKLMFVGNGNVGKTSLSKARRQMHAINCFYPLHLDKMHTLHLDKNTRLLIILYGHGQIKNQPQNNAHVAL